MDHHVYIGVKGSVTCLDMRDGRRIWETGLKGSSFVTVCVDDQIIIAHTGGHAFGLRRWDGELLWENDLPGLGYGTASVTTGRACGDMTAVIAELQEQQRQADAANHNNNAG